MPPEEVARTIEEANPVPYHPGVITTDPGAAIAAYAPLGYKPARWVAEPIMVRSLVGFVAETSRFLVQQVQDEAQRALFNSVIAADEPHGQMGPQELHDARLRFFCIEQTTEDYRRRGMASPMGEKLYAALGYEVAGYHQSFLP